MGSPIIGGLSRQAVMASRVFSKVSMMLRPWVSPPPILLMKALNRSVDIVADKRYARLVGGPPPPATPDRREIGDA